MEVVFFVVVVLVVVAGVTGFVVLPRISPPLVVEVVSSVDSVGSVS